MESYVLSETFKYLYLIFAQPSDLLFDPDDFVFTTEAHLLPLNIVHIENQVLILLTLHIIIHLYEQIISITLVIHCHLLESFKFVS